MSADDYVGRCRAFVIANSERLAPADVGWAMHLIDHDEPAEGLCSLAWAFDSADLELDDNQIDELLGLIGDLVPADALPGRLQQRGGHR